MPVHNSLVEIGQVLSRLILRVWWASWQAPPLVCFVTDFEDNYDSDVCNGNANWTCAAAMMSSSSDDNASATTMSSNDTDSMTYSKSAPR